MTATDSEGQDIRITLRERENAYCACYLMGEGGGKGSVRYYTNAESPFDVIVSLKENRIFVYILCGFDSMIN
jgi:hypothetical protein